MTCEAKALTPSLTSTWTSAGFSSHTTTAAHTIPAMADDQEKGIIGRARGMSLSLLHTTPQLGMWQATATAMAQAPNLTELREPESGGSNITFDAHGHATRVAVPDEDGELTLVKSQTRILDQPAADAIVPGEVDEKTGKRSRRPHGHGPHRRRTLKE